MRPSQLRYTHDSVSNTFRDGNAMETTFLSLLNGILDIDDLQCLVAMSYNQKWFVVRGNRRLYVYKKLEDIGKCSTVTVDKQRFEEILFDRQFTTKNMGLTIRVRGGRNMELILNQLANNWRDVQTKRQRKKPSVRNVYQVADTTTTAHITQPWASSGTSTRALQYTRTPAQSNDYNVRVLSATRPSGGYAPTPPSMANYHTTSSPSYDRPVVSQPTRGYAAASPSRNNTPVPWSGRMSTDVESARGETTSRGTANTSSRGTAKHSGRKDDGCSCCIIL